MADEGTNKPRDRKQAAEDAARVVLAKHPCVVAGSAHEMDCGAEVPSPKPAEGFGERERGVGPLRTQNPTI